MTSEEKDEREYKKKLLSITKEHENARDLERVPRYHIPKDMKKGEKGEYVEVDEREKLPNSKQKKWEAEQLHSALYELLLDDEIEFVQVLRMEESKDADKKTKVSEFEQKNNDQGD